MQFASVEGLIESVFDGGHPALKLTVLLETSSKFVVVREELIDLQLAESLGQNLCWLADQYTQETIGNELANDGWEAIGGGEIPADQESIARSARYVVRRS